MYVFEKGAPPSSASATAPQRTGSKTHIRGAAYSPEVFPVRAKRAMPPYGTAKQRNFIDRWCSVGLCCQWVNGLKHMVPKFRKLSWWWFFFRFEQYISYCFLFHQWMRDRMHRLEGETRWRDQTEKLDWETGQRVWITGQTILRYWTERPDQDTRPRVQTKRLDQERKT